MQLRPARTLAHMTGPSGAAADDSDEPMPPALAEPVRQRLLQVAAEVLGRTPAEEVPPALRAIARFTPAKRVRLGAATLSAALDADAEFRERVADAVAEATPQLVDAVRNGSATTASDPLDTAVVAYLTRPQGWVDLVASVGEQWASEQSARDASTDEITRLRTEVAELRSRLRTDAARFDEAVAAATREASSSSADEVTHLRNLLRTRTGELRAAEQDAAQARAERDRLQAELAGLAEGHDAAVARLRARVAELERAGETVRREARTGRDVHDARLRLLLDTLTDAAAGVRRELALPASTLRPADAVFTVDADPSAAGGVDLDRLLELPQAHLIVDGYNVTKSGYGDLPLADQRARLIAAIAALQARTGVEVTIAFDGGARPPAQPRTPRGVRVLFSAPDEIADDLIRRLVAAEPAGRALVVVTSDQEIVTDVSRAGAWAVASSALLAKLG